MTFLLKSTDKYLQRCFLLLKSAQCTLLENVGYVEEAVVEEEAIAEEAEATEEEVAEEAAE